MEERVYVDGAGRPYRVIAPVEPRRRLYRPGTVNLTAPIPPPTRNLRLSSGFQRPFSHGPASRRTGRECGQYSRDPYGRRSRVSHKARRQYEEAYDFWEEEDFDYYRRRRVTPSRGNVDDEQELRRRGKPQAAKPRPPRVEESLVPLSEGRQPRPKQNSATEQPVLIENDPGEDEDGAILPKNNTGTQLQDATPRDRQGRLQRRHSIGSAHSREHLFQDIHKVQWEEEQRHNRPLPARTVQGRLHSSSRLPDWTPEASSAGRHPRPRPSRDQGHYLFGEEEEEEAIFVSPRRRPQHTSSGYMEEDNPSVSMRPVRDEFEIYDDYYEEENFGPSRRIPVHRRHSFGSMSDYTMDRSYMEESYPSVF